MQDGQFHITSYHGSVPASGYCDKCHGSFVVLDEWSATPEDARKQLQADFDAHTCKRLDESQNAARIIRE